MVMNFVLGFFLLATILVLVAAVCGSVFYALIKPQMLKKKLKKAMKSQHLMLDMVIKFILRRKDLR